MAKNHGDEISKSSPRNVDLKWGLLLVVLTFVGYAPVVQCGYIWDDDDYVTDSPLLHNLKGLESIWFELGATPQYYPLVHTSYWVEYQLWGLHPTGYHLVNVALHACVALVLWRVLLRLEIPAAWLAAAVFALHPVHVESTAWITERKNVLSGVFYLSAMLVWLRYTLNGDSSRHWCWYVLALALFAAALLSKTVTVTLPAALMLLLVWKRGAWFWRDVLSLLPFFAVGVPFGLITVWMEQEVVGAVGAEWEFSLADRFLIAGRALWFYLLKLVMPDNLMFIYPRWTIDDSAWLQYLFPASFLACIAVLWCARRRIGGGPLVAILFFAGTLTPALGFFDVYPMRYSFVADHFQYLASIGPIVLLTSVAWMVWNWPGNRWLSLRPVAGGVVLIVLGALSCSRCYVFEDPETLWSDTIRKNPTCTMAINNLGKYYHEQGRTIEAIQYYSATLELDPTYAMAHNNMALCLLSLDRTELAERHSREAIRIDSTYAEAFNTLGAVLVQTGRFQEAVVHNRAAVRLASDIARYRFNLGNALLRSGQSDDAIATYQKVLQQDPGFVEAYVNLGVAYFRRDDYVAAEEHFRAALRVDPNLDSAHKGLQAVRAGKQARGQSNSN